MWLLLAAMMIIAVPVLAQTPTPTSTADASTRIVMTIEAASQSYPAAVDLTVTAGEVHIANLLTAILISIWSLILLIVWFVVAVRRWR